MSNRSFSLIPFPAPNLLEISITGEILLQNSVITLHYSLVGKIDEIFFSKPVADPARKDELWKSTCFEFFLAIKDMPQYWEFNMSPSGDWNVYHMDAYRRIGFREETLIQQLQFETQQAANQFTLDTAVDLKPVIQKAQILEVGITAIVQTHEGNETYWALTHPAPQADFHSRESFVLVLGEHTRLSQQSALGG